MLDIRPADMLDLAAFKIDARQAAVMPGWRHLLRGLIQTEQAMAVRWHGAVLAFAGLSVVWHNRAAAWCFLAASIPPAAWVPMTRAAQRALAGAAVKRIEADISADFPPAARWARMLGMRQEGAMAAYWGDATYLRFARIAA